MHYWCLELLFSLYSSLNDFGVSMLHILLIFFSSLSHYSFPIYLKLFTSIFILSYSFITHILSFTFHTTTYIFLTSYHFYLFFYISLIPSSHSTPLLMVDSFEECTWFDGKFTNFVRIWAYEQPLCSNYFCYVNINLSLFILELALLCMLKPHYGILCIKMIRANHLPFFYSRNFFFLYPKIFICYLCLSLNHYPSNSLRLLNHFSSFFSRNLRRFLDSLCGYILLLFLPCIKVSQLDQQALCLN